MTGLRCVILPLLLSLALLLSTALPLALAQYTDNNLYFCNLQYGNPAGAAAAASGGAGYAWTIATSGFLNLSTPFTFSSSATTVPSFTIASAYGLTRVYTPAAGTATTSSLTLSSSSAGSAVIQIYQQNLDPRTLSSTGLSFTLSTAAPQPGVASSVSSITLSWDSASNTYRETGAEAPLYSAFNYWPLGPSYGAAAYSGALYPPCQALSSTPAQIAASPTTTTLAFGFCYSLTSPRGQATSGWAVQASGIITTVAQAVNSSAAETNSPYLIFNMASTVGTRQMTLGNGTVYKSSIIALEPVYEGVEDGGPDNFLYAANGTSVPQWLQNAIPADDNGDGFIWGPTYLDGNGFTYDMYPPSPVAGSVISNFSTFLVGDINFYWNRNYREVNEPNHQDPQGQQQFLITPFSSSTPFLNNIPTCTLPTQTWSFCYMLWGGAGSTGAWAVATSGTLTTDFNSTVQINPLRSAYGFNNPAYRVTNLAGVRTFYTPAGAQSTATISGFWGIRAYGPLASVSPTNNQPPLLYVYTQNQDARVVDQFGFTYFTSSPGQLSNGSQASTFTINWNNVTNQYWEGSESPLYSYFQYWPTGDSLDIIPSCTPFSTSSVTVWQFCYTLAAPSNNPSGQWTSAASGLLITGAATIPTTLTGSPQAYFVYAITGSRTHVTGAGVTSVSSIIALEPLNGNNTLLYNAGQYNLPDGGPDNLYIPPSSNYQGTATQLDGNGIVLQLYPPTLLEAPNSGTANVAPLRISDTNFYWNGNYREVTEPNHQPDTGPANFTVATWSQGTAINTCKATPTGGAAAGTQQYTFCYLAYSATTSTTGPWAVSLSGIITTSSSIQYATSSQAVSNNIPFVAVQSITGTRTYIQGSAAPAIVAISSGTGSAATGNFYPYVHNNSRPLQDSRALDTTGITYQLSANTRLPGATVSYDGVQLVWTNSGGGQYQEYGVTGSGTVGAEVPGLSSFSWRLLEGSITAAPLCYPYPASNVPNTNALVTPSGTSAVAAFCWQVQSLPGDPTGPWGAAGSGLMVLNGTLGPETFGQYTGGGNVVYTISGMVGTRTFANGSLTSTVNIIGMQDPVDSDGGADSELYVNPPPAALGTLLDFDGFTVNLWPPTYLGSSAGNNGFTINTTYFSMVTDVEFYYGGGYRELNEPFHENFYTGYNAVNSFTYTLLSGSAAISNIPSCPAIPGSGTSSGSGGGSNNNGGGGGGSGLSHGQIAGIVIGSVVGGLLLLCLCIFIVMRVSSGDNTTKRSYNNESSTQRNVEMQPVD